MAHALRIVEDDFLNAPFTDLGRTVVRTPRTKTISNNSGSPTYTSAATENITAMIFKRGITYDWAKEGLFEGGDAIMYVEQTQALNKEDLMAIGGETFRVDTIILRTAGSVSMFKTCNLFKVL